MSIGGGKSRGAGGRDPATVFKQLQGFLEPIYGDLISSTENIIGQNQYTNLNYQSNPYINQIVGGSQYEALRAARESYQGTKNLPRELQGLLGAQSDASTRAAALAARTAGGGRGGLAYGGGAASIAGQSAAASASALGAGYLGALVQGRQAQVGAAQNLTSAANAILQGRQAQAGIVGQYQSLNQQLSQQNRLFNVEARLSPRQKYLEILGGISSSAIGGTGGSPGTRSKSKQGNSSF